MADSTVCLTYDFDAVSAWTANGMPGFASWGVYGADVAAPRLLDLHESRNVPATWFIPGHTIESFPEVCERVAEAGHEIAHHGWSHRSLSSFPSKAAERRDLERGIETITALTGERPVGFRTPDGGYSTHTKELLVELEFEWDSSDSAHDFRPYRLRKGSEPRVHRPYIRGEETDLVEVPYVWHRDDWMQLFPVVSGPEWVAYSTEPAVFDRWQEEFDWMNENLDGGVFTLLLHPQCAGRVPFLRRLQTFIERVQAADDARFATVGTVANEFEATVE